MSDGYEGGGSDLMHDSLRAFVVGHNITEGGEFDSAVLRRVISASYYALFHRLIYESVWVMFPNDTAHERFLRDRTSRAFPHGEMADICEKFAKSGSGTTFKPSLAPLLGPIRDGRVPELKIVAQSFCDLQSARLDSDYNGLYRPTNDLAIVATRKMVKAFSDINTAKRDDEGFRLFALALATTAIKRPPGS